MNITLETVAGWQRKMQEHRWRGCLACLGEALAQGYLCDAQEFSFNEFTFTCPRHNITTLPAREFIIEFSGITAYPVYLRADCQDPVKELRWVWQALDWCRKSGVFFRLQRAHIPRRRDL